MFNVIWRLSSGFVLLSILLMVNSSYGNGVVLVSKGDNEIFTNASASSKGEPPRVFFEGKHYTLKKAKIGMKVKTGDVVKTENKGMVRLGFSTGDSINVGPASAMVLDLGQKTVEKKSSMGITPVLNLIYGKFRAIISKKSPMKNIEIKTRVGTAGVRGTDFYIGYNPSVGSMVTTVFRGAVEVAKEVTEKVADSTAPKVIKETVKPGHTLVADSKTEKMAMNQSTKSEIKEIHEISDVALTKEEFKKLPPESKKLVIQTEKACQKAVFDDIKSTNPQLAEYIEKKKIRSTRLMNALSLNKVMKTAPGELKNEKLSEEDMKKLINDDVYEEYGP
ncbi:MAG TPA: hypothetical protein DCL41_07030 [Bdellovibrionales bacterium]|nr:hypothetical protein [Pseudobdellovibrionaceae bacterium]HAG91607.1 hypothetical protein [Bdellovibrionales bacterium]